MEYETIGSLLDTLSKLPADEFVNLDATSLRYMNVVFVDSKLASYNPVNEKDQWNNLNFGRGRSTVEAVCAVLKTWIPTHKTDTVTVCDTGACTMLAAKTQKIVLHEITRSSLAWVGTHLNKPTAKAQATKFTEELAKFKAFSGVDAEMIQLWLGKVCSRYPDLRFRLIEDSVLTSDAELKALYPLASPVDFQQLQPNLWQFKLMATQLMMHPVVYQVGGLAFDSLDKVKVNFDLEAKQDISKVFKQSESKPTLFICALDSHTLKMVYGK